MVPFAPSSIVADQGCFTEYRSARFSLFSSTSTSSWSSLNLTVSQEATRHCKSTTPTLAHWPSTLLDSDDESVRDAELTLLSAAMSIVGWGEVVSGASSSMGLHYDSSVLNTYNLSLLCKASLCPAECVSSSTWEMRTRCLYFILLQNT